MAWSKRRKRPNVAWLPVIGSVNGADQVVAPILPLAFSMPIKGDGSIATYLTALTLDTPPEQALAANQVQTLADFEQSAYRLRRLVGKIHLVRDQNNDGQNATPNAALVTAGFIVLRVNEETGNPLQTDDQYNPLNEDNIRDPWIWRRSWCLGNNFGTQLNAVSAAGAVAWFPATNVYYGSMIDGPHFDTKVGRVIMPEERLFLVIGTQALENAAFDGLVTGVIDYRILASMRKATNRRNASR